MAAYHNIPLRIARNRTLNLVSAAIQYLPVQDLPVYYNPNPDFGTSIKIYVIGVEADVDYVLRNERGDMIAGNIDITGKPNDLDATLLETIRGTCSLFPEEARDHPSLVSLPASSSLFIHTWKRVVEFDSPEITGDRAYTILASRPNQQGYFLPTAINLRPDKKALIGVELQDDDTLLIQKEDTFDIIMAQGNRPRIVFSIILLKSLISVTYQVVNSASPDVAIVTKTGDGNDIKLEVEVPMPLEEATYKVMGIINAGTATERVLTEPLKILNVRIGPDPAIDWNFAVSPAEFPFLAVPAVQIAQPRNGVGYQLFLSPLPEPRFTIFDGSAKDDAAIVAASGNPNPEGLVPAFFFNAQGALDETNNALLAGSRLHEDSVLFVRMKMPPLTGRGQWLTNRLFARVKPDPGIRMSVVPPFYSSNEDKTVQIRLHNTQKGVGYQLRQIGAAAPVTVMLTDAARLGRIGWEAHGRVFGMRIFSDKAAAKASSDYFIIENNEDVSPDLIVVLPIPADDTAYEVEAVKEYTGLTVLLTQGVLARKGYLQLNGAPDRIVATGYKGIPAGQARTIEAWIRTSKAGPVLVWGTAGTAGAKWLLRLNADGKLELDIQGAQLTGVQNLIDGQWRHIACILAPPATGPTTLAHASLWVDGKLEIQGVGAQPINTGSDMDMIIGNDGATAFFEGDMAELRIWERAVPEAELENNLYKRLTGDETGLALYWKLNDGTGAVATDSRLVQARNGTLEGGTWK